MSRSSDSKERRCNLPWCGFLVLLCWFLLVVACEHWLLPQVTEQLESGQMEDSMNALVLSRRVLPTMTPQQHREKMTKKKINPKGSLWSSKHNKHNDRQSANSSTEHSPKTKKHSTNESWTNINIAFFTMDCSSYQRENMEKGRVGLGEYRVRQSLMESLTELSPPFVHFTFYCITQCQCVKWLTAHTTYEIGHHLKCSLLPTVLHWIFFDEYTFTLSPAALNKYGDSKVSHQRIADPNTKPRKKKQNVRAEKNSAYANLRTLILDFIFLIESDDPTPNKKDTAYDLQSRSFLLDFFGNFMAKKMAINTYKHALYNESVREFAKFGALTQYVVSRQWDQNKGEIVLSNGEVMTKSKVNRLYEDMIQHDALLFHAQKAVQLLGTKRLLSAFPNRHGQTATYLGYALPDSLLREIPIASSDIMIETPQIGVIYAHECQYLANPNVQFMLGNVSMYCKQHNITLISVLNFTELYFSTHCRKLLQHTSNDTLNLLWNTAITFVGFQSEHSWFQILKNSSFLLGLGNPCFGPSVFEAFAFGNVFINILYDERYGTPNRCLDMYGTGSNKFRSQHDYALELVEKYQKEEYICNVHIWDHHTLIRRCIEKQARHKPPSWIPFELTKAGHNERVQRIFADSILRLPRVSTHVLQENHLHDRYGYHWEKTFPKDELTRALNGTYQKQLAAIDKINIQILNKRREKPKQKGSEILQT
ncbi:hypothetical protein RFI_12424 [Reticulomyxa filosa]|uniref:Glycosyltransferase family 18 catalytic domain-containing protein n=1 Tax=Reticulomyxa filosa TaxID=46433 RepID=X6NHA8_RETFI|nr:hypothetical protein RFI_12424 [Reticulomyxa filosa]|eukprot:ETO24737.1 hypothetical protein RFI_12424 [Reticulomyxa filosa]